MSTQPSPQLTVDTFTPFDSAAEVLAPGVREAHAPAPGVGELGPRDSLANGELIDRLVGDVQWMRLAFQSRYRPLRPGRRAWVVTAPDRGFGKTHFFNSLAQRLDGDAVVVAVGPGAVPGNTSYWERGALGALMQALDRAEAGGALAPATPATGNQAASQAIESHWTALARGVLAGAVRELLAASAERAGDRTPASKHLQEAAQRLPPELKRTSHWKALLDHVLSKPTLLEAVADALRDRGVVTQARLSTWLNVFHTLLFADDLELRAACRRWIGGRPVATDLCDQMGVAECDRLVLEGDGEIARQQALERIADLSHFAAFYVPLVFCVEHHEPVSGGGADDATGRSRRPLPREQDPLAHMLEAMAPSLAHAVLVLALDQVAHARCDAQWSGDLKTRWRAPISLQGLGALDAQRLVDARLRAARVDGTTATAMVGDGQWLQALTAAASHNPTRLSARRFLATCAERYRSEVLGAELSPPAPSPAPPPDVQASPTQGPGGSFAAAWETAREEVGEPTPVQVHDALVPLLRLLGEQVEDIEVVAGDPPLTQLGWQGEGMRYGIAVGVADTRQRWGQLARRALLGERAVTVCLRLPGEMEVPNPAWPVAASMLERAISAGRLRVVRLTDEQCHHVAAAALLHEQLEPRLDGESRQHAWALIGERLSWLSEAILAAKAEVKTTPAED
ncbi:MAG: hypothetical protein AAF184_07815 [Pseudomonadota bacterium]